MKLQKDFLENIFPAKLRNFESLLKERNEGKGFFLGDKVSVKLTSFFQKEKDCSLRVCSRWLETFYSLAVGYVLDSHALAWERGETGGGAATRMLRRRGRRREKRHGGKRDPISSLPSPFPLDACQTGWGSSSKKEFSDFYEFWSSY